MADETNENRDIIRRVTQLERDSAGWEESLTYILDFMEKLNEDVFLMEDKMGQTRKKPKKTKKRPKRSRRRGKH